MKLVTKKIQGSECYQINGKGSWKKLNTQSAKTIIDLVQKVEELEEKMERKDVLLKATSDILKKYDETYYVTEFSELTTFYDGTECDSYCLWEDIKIELNID